jgi:hypothetical protein
VLVRPPIDLRFRRAVNGGRPSIRRQMSLYRYKKQLLKDLFEAESSLGGCV